MRNKDLEPGSRTIGAGLADGDAGYPEDRAGEEETVSRVPEVFFVEDVFLVFRRYAGTVVLAHDPEAVRLFAAGEPDLRHPFAVPDRVLEKGVEHLLEERIGLDLGLADFRRE